MGRKKLDPAKRRQSLSISVRRDIAEMADATDNASRFFERSVECSAGIHKTIERLRAGQLSKRRAFEEIEDIVDHWESQFDEELPFEGNHANLRGQRIKP